MTQSLPPGAGYIGWHLFLGGQKKTMAMVTQENVISAIDLARRLLVSAINLSEEAGRVTGRDANQIKVDVDDAVRILLGTLDRLN